MSKTDNKDSAPEIALTIKREASAVIWHLSRAHGKVLNDVENPRRISLNQVLALGYMLKSIDWLSGIACDDWWWGDTRKSINDIREEIKVVPILAVIRFFRLDAFAWESFCGVVCEHLEAGIVYGSETIEDMADESFGFDDLAALGAQHGLIGKAVIRSGVFRKKRCLVEI